MFKHVVTSEQELRDLMGTPSERAIKKESPFIDEPSREFIAHAPFLLLATSDATGRCDVSPKGDAPGFVHVLDERHLVIPDRPGTQRLDGLRNLLDNPHVGLIFLIPGREET
ncbi:MAG: pyridoxamine 5'-phosphate oxidase family protein, partial [Candidatus Rokuibacteriota bacterium]